LFLILIQYSWYVVLFGAEIAFANEHVDQYELKNEINKFTDSEIREVKEYVKYK